MVPGLGRVVRQRRRALGLSVEKAARKADLSSDMWYKVEKDRCGVSLASAIKIAKALDLSLQELVDRVCRQE